MMCATLRLLLNEEAGATAVEYGLIAALVSVAAIAALVTMGDSLEGIFDFIAATLSAATV